MLDDDIYIYSKQKHYKQIVFLLACLLTLPIEMRKYCSMRCGSTG